VQILTNGGVGSKSNPTNVKGILGIEENWEYKLKHRGCGKQPD